MGFDFTNLPFINCFEAGLIVVTFIVGFIVNTLSLSIIIRHKSFYNSFGYILAYLAFANISALLIIACWATPWTLFAVPHSVHGANLLFGSTALFFAEAGFHGTLLISINRFVAITFPLGYRVWFTRKFTIFMLVFITCLPLSYWAVLQIETCDFYYDHDLRIWRFGLHPCSVFLSTYIDMIYNISLFIFVAIFDLVTLLKLQTIKKSTSRTKFCAVSVTEETKHKKEVKLFAQAFLTSIVNSVMLTSFNWVSTYMPEGFCLFICTTYAWELSHVLVGLILIWFNPEIRRHIVGVRQFVKFFSNPTSTVIGMSHQTPSRT